VIARAPMRSETKPALFSGASATRATTLPLMLGLLSFAAFAQGEGDQSAEELAKKLSNPIASLISVPFQGNYDDKIGPARAGHRFTLNIQPVIPVEINKEWNLISRTILPITDQHDIFPGAGNQSGIGDVVQSFFFSPKAPTADGWIWGAGPVLLLPTGSDDLLSARKWGAGPTGVALKQESGWTYGMLFNHIWSFAGDSDRSHVSSTFLQPFLAYTTKDAWTYGLNTESTYDWNAKQWSVPINASVAKLVRFGKQPVSLGLNARYWAESPDSAPHGWGIRFIVTFLFPA
jgi:hypothetical protein